MLKLAALCSTALLAVAANAQCTPNTLTCGTAGTNSGNLGGGIYFDLTVNTTITITAMNFMCGPATVAGTGSMEVWLGPATWVGNNTNPALWTLVDSTVPAAVAPSTVSTGTLTNGFSLGPGTYGVALRSQTGVWNHGYGNPGQSPNPTSTPELTFTAGGATNAWFTSPTFSTRIWNGNIAYTCGGTPIAVATSEPYGNGCYQFNTSYGEITPNPSTSFDLLSHTITHSYTGVYNITATATPNNYTAPGAGAVTLPLAAGTDSTSIVAALGGPLPFPILFPYQGGLGVADDLEVCASGFVTPVDVAGAGTTAPAAGANPGDLSPTIDEFFTTGQARWAPLWTPMAPSGAGTVTVEVIGSPATDIVISWNGVGLSGLATTLNSFQIVFDAFGNVTYRYDAAGIGVGAGGSWPILVGWSEGNNAIINEVDVSGIVLAPIATDPVDNPALDLSLDARPVLGTNPNLVIDGYDPLQVALGFLLFDFGQVNPGQSLAAFGAPGCSNFVPLTAVGTAFVTGGTAPATRPVISGGIPNSPTLNGLQFFSQAAALQAMCAGNPCNTLGATFSNGLRLFFGSL
ncbi:MAG: hypothetical protein KDE27_27300 [Planctomycetes bacterium]|nr:hypothetical protein [Planctomycetota bacterium]